MKHTKRKISKIVDELLNYLFHIGGNGIEIKINEEMDRYVIDFKCEFNLLKREYLTKMCHYLSVNRNKQMESYYWELAGETETNQELTLIGMMIDDYSLKVIDNQLELKLIRKK